MWQVIINGPGYFGACYDLPNGVTYIGRADNNDIVLSGDQVSRRHAKLEIREQALTVEDLGSRNGTEVNGQRLGGAKLIQSGDVVGIGENVLTLRSPTAAETARTDPFDLEQLAASAPHTSSIKGEVIFERGVSDAPFVDAVLPPEAGGAAEGDYLALLLKVIDRLSTAQGLHRFLEEVIDLVMEVSQAKTAVALVKDERGKLAPLVVRHPNPLKPGEVPVSDAIVADVARRKVALAVANAKDDIRFAERESVVLYDLEQVLCVPMVRGAELLGILYLNRKASDRQSLSRLVDVVGAIARMAADGVERWRHSDHAHGEDLVRRALERFHAPLVVEKLVAEGATRQPPKKLEPKLVTVMFLDIAGFSRIADELAPEKVSALLHEFYSNLDKIVFSFDGTLDKFLGDAVMAVFGAPYTRPDDASRGVRCALACRRKFMEMMVRRPVTERCGIRVGVNTGRALVGLLGDERIDFAAVGEDVNIAAWTQAAAAPGQLLITGKTLAAIGARFDVQPLGERELRPGGPRVPLFEVQEEDSYLNTMPGL